MIQEGRMKNRIVDVRSRKGMELVQVVTLTLICSSVHCIKLYLGHRLTLTWDGVYYKIL